MNVKKIGVSFSIVFLLVSLFIASCPTTTAAQVGGNNQYSLWGGFTDEDTNHIDSPHGYTYNGTLCIPYYNGSTLIGGAVRVDSHYMDYTFYGNITYSDGSLFEGTYTAYLGQQSPDIALAINFDATYIWDNGAINTADFYYSGYSGALDDRVYNWFSNLPPLSELSGTTYLGIKYNFVNASTGANYNVIYLLVIDEYLGQNSFGTPNPTINIDWGLGSAPTSYEGFLMYGIGLALTFIGLVILMKASGAWMPALFLIAIGLVVVFAAWTSIISLVGWAMVVLISPIFLYSGNKGAPMRR